MEQDKYLSQPGESRAAVMRILNRFQQCYDERNAGQIDDFMKTLFDPQADLLVLGTSDGEWYTGFENAKEIFLADWEGWGDVKIDLDHVRLAPDGDTAVMVVPGTVSMEFSNDDETNERYLDVVRGFFQDDPVDSRKTTEQKLADINWILAHFLHARQPGVRRYEWPVLLSGVLAQTGGRWVFRQMQFGMQAGTYPDERIQLEVVDYYSQAYEKNRERLIAQVPEGDEVEIRRIRELLGARLSDSLSETVWMADPAHELHHGRAAVEQALTSLEARWGKLVLEAQNARIRFQGDTAWLATIGWYKNHVARQEIFEQCAQDVMQTAQSGLSPLEALFRIRRDIAWTFREAARGDDYRWPLRCEALLRKAEDGWRLHYLRLSFPFDMILEGKLNLST